MGVLKFSKEERNAVSTRGVCENVAVCVCRGVGGVFCVAGCQQRAKSRLCTFLGKFRQSG